MSALDIPPHPHATSRLAVAALGLIAAFALTSGFLRQVVKAAPQAPVVASATDTIAEATPAPEPTLQTAEPPPRRVHVAEAEPVDLSDEIAPVAEPPAAASDGAADAAASVPDPTPAPPSEQPSLTE